MDIGQFCRELSSDMPSFVRRIVFLQGAGGEVPVRVLQVPSDPSRPFPIVVVFHGARPEGAPYPMFYGHQFAGEETSDKLLIAIADPTLAANPELRFGWYCGYRGIDAPAAIHTFLDALTSTLEPSRLILFGASIGAHPALRFAKHFPGSVAVLVNPICQISSYYEAAVRHYFETCWPGEFDDRSLQSEAVLDDAGSLFDDGPLQSTVAILQNATDRHLIKQVAPLIARLGQFGQSAPKLLPIVSFFPGFIGHNMPHDEMGRCIEAAVRAADTDALSIAMMREELSTVDKQAERPLPVRDTSRDITLARELAQQAAK